MEYFYHVFKSDDENFAPKVSSLGSFDQFANGISNDRRRHNEMGLGWKQRAQARLKICRALSQHFAARRCKMRAEKAELIS
jgi:hypothetical protein